jgi:tetratricopeptide (TPR) repeat protein
MAMLAGIPACSGDQRSTPTSRANRTGDAADPRSTELPALPELDGMAASVQHQIRERRATLESVVRRGSISDSALASEFGAMGQLLMAAESVAAAKPYFLRAAELDPAESRWPYYLGHLHRMQGDIESAANYFARTLALGADNVPALVWLGNVYLDQGQPARAAPLYERALNQQPALFAALFGLGRVELVRGSYSKAAEYLEAALRAEPRASAVHYPLAVAYRQLGRLAEAESHLRRRGEDQPAPPDPLMQEVAGLLESSVVFEQRGDRALARGDPAAAVIAFRRGVELSPDRAALKQKLATSLALTGDVKAALELYQQLLQQDPNFAEAHYSLGALLLGNGRPDLAIDRFAAAVHADPTYLQARLQLAHTLRQVGRLDRALVEYQGALSIDPRVAEARLGYAISLARLGRWGAARAWLIEGRRAYPDRPEFSESLARLLAAAPDSNVRDGAQALDLARNLVSRSRSWSTLEAVAMALAETGEYTAAVSRQREAMDAYRRENGKSNVPMADCLRRYERREPCRVPWSADPIR